MVNPSESTKKVFIDTLIVGGIIQALLLIFCIFELYMVPLGFLLGFIVSLINYGILNLQGHLMLNKENQMSTIPLTMTCYFTRFILYAGGLFLAFYLEYIGVNLFAWYMVFIGYMVNKAVIFIKYGSYAKTKPSDFNGGK